MKTVQDIVIIGAGGLAQEILWLIRDINAERERWRVVGFLSERPEEWGRTYHGLPVLPPESFAFVPFAVLGLASPLAKKRLTETYPQYEYPNLLHPLALRTMDVRISGQGICVFAGTYLMPCSELRSFCYLNVRCVIGHDTTIGRYASVSPGALVMGNCTVGRLSFIGAGVSTRERISVGEGCVIGSGAAIVSDIPDWSMAVGVPAKVIKTLEAVHG